MIIDVYERDERWYFRILSRNGRVVHDTGAACEHCKKRPHGYRRKKAAVDMANKIAAGITAVSVQD